MSRADLESLRAYLEQIKQKYIEPLERELKIAESIAKGAQQAISFSDYSSLSSAFNSIDKNQYKIGQSIMIGTLNVPDLWVYSVEDTEIPYSYFSDEDFVTELKANGYVQIGYYKLSPLETQKVDLTDYVKKTEVEAGYVAKYTDYSGFKKVYGVTHQGVQTMYIADATLSGAQADRIPVRGKNGIIYVPTASITEATAAVNMEYVDNAVKNAGGGTTLYLHELHGASISMASDYVLFFICNTSNKIENSMLPFAFNERVLAGINVDSDLNVIIFARFNIAQDVISSQQNGETSTLLTFADGTTKQVDFSENNLASYEIIAL